MNTYLWLVVIPNLSKLTLILCVLMVLVFGSCIIPYAVSVLENYESESEKQLQKKLSSICKKSSVIFFTSLFISVFFPSKAEIIQVKALNLLSEVKGIDKLPANLVAKLNELFAINDKDEE